MGKSDEELMMEVSGGSLSAFEALMGRYEDRILNFIVRFTGHVAVAEDLFQETFVRVFQARAGYRPRAKFSTWLYTIAYRLCLDELRRAKHRRTESLDAGVRTEPGKKVRSVGDTVRDAGADPLERLRAAEKEAIVRKAVRSLPDSFRSFFIFSVYEGLGYDEIAAIEGISVTAVRMRASRAHRALKKELERYREEYL